ncbi:alpha/beta hydrolase [Lewinella sp. LCG006]|uniref:tetratricopeptide repeat protein n=1 Tax=Lewinella sp. LCG006 TaxID=3231911 RepID=UPI00345F83B0
MKPSPIKSKTDYWSHLLTLCLLLASNFANTQVSYLDIDLNYGPNEVGYNYLNLLDSSRIYERKMNYEGVLEYRPIGVSVWYPSENNKLAEKVEIAAYVDRLKIEQEWEHLPQEFLLEWFGYNSTLPSQQNLEHLARSIKAGNQKAGKYPLIVYCPSYQAPSTENFILCEYLASHGFVVISTASKGPYNVYLQGGTIQDAEAQARDIEYAIGYASSLENVNPDHKYLVGFSFGGLSDILVAMRNKRIKGIISLDGTVKYKWEAIKNSTWCELQRLKVPFIHFSQKNIPVEVLKKEKLDTSINSDFAFFDELTETTKYEFRMKDLTHGYFSSFGALFIQRDTVQDKSYPEISDSYAKLCHLVLASIQSISDLNKEEMEWNHDAFLSRLQLNNSVALIKYEAPTPPLKDQFLRHIEQSRKEDFVNLHAIYQEIISIDESYSPQEGDLNVLGLQLIFRPSTFKQGERVFKFALELYPNSANLYDSLAEGYRIHGDRELAIANFKKSLELYPGNSNAKKRLLQMGATTETRH